jgi:hypothetical protein
MDNVKVLPGGSGNLRRVGGGSQKYRFSLAIRRYKHNHFEHGDVNITHASIEGARWSIMTRELIFIGPRLFASSALCRLHFTT